MNSDVVHAVVLAFVQGATEFLPISSSGHLILLPHLAAWRDQGLGFDIAVHFGALVAVLAYFRSDITHMSQASWTSLTCGVHTEFSRLTWIVLIAVLPVAIAAYWLREAVSMSLRLPLVIATATFGFGLVLGWADKYGRRCRGLSELGWRDGVLIGLMQALALIPGTSRSGITITAGLMLGFTRQAAARFSFLLSIPTIVLASGWMVWSWSAAESMQWSGVLVGAGVSAVVAYLCIHLFLRFVEQTSLLPFVIYRLLLGMWLFYIYW